MPILDLYEGASILPHVYCKKITLENGVDSTLVTLNLELLANAATIRSGWAKKDNLKFEKRTVNSFNSIFVQVVPVVGSAVKLLKASNDPINLEQQGPTNIYVAKRQLNGTNWIPYGKADKTLLGNTGRAWPELQAGVIQAYSTNPNSRLTARPINLNEGGIFSAHAGEGFSKAAARGKIRKSIKDGKTYYEMPLTFEFNYTNRMGDLGFMFYTMFHAPHLVKSLFGTEDEQKLKKHYKFNQFGPMNSEIVFENGVLVERREQFITNNGMPWDGSVHLHASNINGPGGPDQNGYSGNGGFGANGGWMAGEQHVPDANQPKLRLTLAQNDKIDDFRISSNPPTPINVVGAFSSTQPGEILANAQVNSLVGPFQKTTRKDFTRKNDDEFSKLYYTRDAKSTLRGSFLIDFRNFIKNNSSLFRTILLNKDTNLDVFGNQALDEILSKSKILEMKLFRERIDKNFENKQSKVLIQTLSENTQIGDLVQSSLFAEVNLHNNFSGKRMFAFNDRQTEFISCGTYKYSIEIKFKDGSYEFILDLINSLKNTLSYITEYYNLASSSKPAAVGSYVDKSIQRKSLYKKLKFKPYFDKLYNCFSDNFAKDLFAQGDNIPPLAEKFKLPNDQFYVWHRAPMQLFELQTILGSFNIKNFTDVKVLNSMMDPIEGSPSGINHVIKIYNDIIDNLKNLLGNKKIKSSGGELTVNNSTSYSEYASQNYRVPTSAIIESSHDFDNLNSLYKASSINNLFVDYLQIGMADLNSKYSGLITLTPEYFKNRCILDSAKFSKASTTKASFNTTNIGMLRSTSQASGDLKTTQVNRDDYLKNSGYSFLTPSTVYFSDRSISETRFFTCFSPTADSSLNTGDDNIFDSSFFTCDYESLLAVIMKHANEKIQNTTTDIITNDEPYNQRLAHVKSLLSDLNITFHFQASHDNFFDQRPGAANGEKDGIATAFSSLYKEPRGLDINKYSDGPINPLNYFNTATSILSSPQQFEIKYPRFKIISLSGLSNMLNDANSSAIMPNNIKLFLHQLNRKQLNQDTLTNQRLEIAKDNNENAFLFFNYNMTVAVEVYMHSDGVMKDDASSWRLLTEDDLNDLKNKKIFCRLRPYFENDIADVDIPILNQYFFIGSSVGSFAKPSGTSSVPNDLMQTIQRMQQKLLLKINEESKSIKKNLTLTPASSKAGPGISTPSAQPTRTATATAVAAAPASQAPSPSTTATTQYSSSPTQGSSGGSTSSY